jgi:hypothetical protein
MAQLYLIERLDRTVTSTHCRECGHQRSDIADPVVTCARFGLQRLKCDTNWRPLRSARCKTQTTVAAKRLGLLEP